MIGIWFEHRDTLRDNGFALVWETVVSFVAFDAVFVAAIYAALS